MPSYIDRLLAQLRDPEAQVGWLDEAMRRWNNDLSATQREQLACMGSTMDWVLAQIDSRARLRPGENQRALRELGVKSRATLMAYIDKSLAFRDQYPQAPLAYALVNLAGRPPRSILTLEEQLLAIGAY